MKKLLLLMLAATTTLLVPGTASASTAAGADTIVGTFGLADQVCIGDSASQTLEFHRGCEPTYDQLAPDSLLAAKGGAKSAANAIRLNRQLAAQEIASGHAFGKHAESTVRSISSGFRRFRISSG